MVCLSKESKAHRCQAMYEVLIAVAVVNHNFYILQILLMHFLFFGVFGITLHSSRSLFFPIFLKRSTFFSVMGISQFWLKFLSFTTTCVALLSCQGGRSLLLQTKCFCFGTYAFQLEKFGIITALYSEC